MFKLKYLFNFGHLNSESMNHMESMNRCRRRRKKAARRERGGGREILREMVRKREKKRERDASRGAMEEISLPRFLSLALSLPANMAATRIRPISAVDMDNLKRLG